MKLLMGEVTLAARTILGEARGEDYEGKKLVAHVIINRWKNKHRGETTIAGVVTEPKQFSAWNLSDPNRVKLETVQIDNENLRECMRAFLEAFDEEDPTKGAMFYHTAAVTPRWASGHAPILKHGHHIFYNDVK